MCQYAYANWAGLLNDGKSGNNIFLTYTLLLN